MDVCKYTYSYKRHFGSNFLKEKNKIMAAPCVCYNVACCYIIIIWPHLSNKTSKRIEHENHRFN